MIKAAVHGFGNIGRHVLDCLGTADDFECLGVVRRAASLGKDKSDLQGNAEFSSIEELAAKNGRPDVVILCGPSRLMPDEASVYLNKGYNTVDSFDIHGEIPALVRNLDEAARKAGRACITAAGWDPGTDSLFRAIFEAMAPVGTTFTNFGRGRSMGHSVAARAIPGVADAIAITIPIGGGRHSRLVYVLPEAAEASASVDSANRFAAIKQALAADPYFASDPLEVREVGSERELAQVADNSHGVLMERIGASGTASNQRLAFDMRIDNPALTAQVLVSSARAVLRLQPGCHTLIDVPPVFMLPGDRYDNIARLV
jgi:diaminopimelate dehydrogenase